MISHIKSFFETEFFNILDGKEASGEVSLSDDKKQLACAALLIEVAIVDNEFDQEEFAALQAVLASDFGVDEEQCKTLSALAQQECEASTCTYQFTQLVNNHCTAEDKYSLIKGMWTIAYADGDLDKYEEYVIRKVSDLIYVSHADFIRAKIEARPEPANAP